MVEFYRLVVFYIVNILALSIALAFALPIGIYSVIFITRGLIWVLSKFSPPANEGVERRYQ